MSANFHIRHVPYKEIDIAKWDNCIATAPNGLIYGYSYYLDHMAKQWDGLVLGDYEAVMPLTWNRKYGIVYCYSPPLTPQTGLFGKIPTTAEKVLLLKKIVSFASYGDCLFNYANKLQYPFGSVTALTNFMITLDKDYATIRNNYNEDLLKNLKKAEKQALVYLSGIENIDNTIDGYSFLYGNRTPHVKEKDYNNFKSLCQLLLQKGQCFIREVKDDQENLLASALLLKDKRRIYNIMNSTTVLGRKKEANHFLIDNILKEFANTNMIFDFDGSDLPGVKQFYEKFGPINQPYYHWHYNKLPFFVKLFKK